MEVLALHCCGQSDKLYKKQRIVFMANILIVDDSLPMRKQLKNIFEELGHVVVAEASNGEEGVQLYEEHQPDLVTMDFTMPKLNGVASLTKIVELDPDAKVIMVTALDKKYTAFQAIKHGAANFIVKPLDADKVKEVIEEVLSGAV